MAWAGSSSFRRLNSHTKPGDTFGSCFSFSHQRNSTEEQQHVLKASLGLVELSGRLYELDPGEKVAKLIVVSDSQI